MMGDNRRIPKGIENHHDDPIMLMVKLRKKLETLNRRMQRINALRIKNTWMRQKLESRGIVPVPTKEPRDPIGLIYIPNRGHKGLTTSNTCTPKRLL